MGSRHENLEDPMAIVIEDMIYVAVGKEVKEFKSILLWALQNSGGKRICILHVHQPAQLIPFMGTRAPASSLKEKIVREHRETERQKMHEILDEYLLFCRQTGVRAQKLEIEMDRIEKGILELISRHQIKRLVMGAAAEKHYKRKMTELKSNKAKYVREQAPISCHIQFICKGHLIFTREASAEMSTGRGESNLMKSRSVTLGHERNSMSEIRESDYLRSQSSVAAGQNRDNSGRGMSILDLISLPAGSANEEASSPKTSPSASDHEWDGLRRSPSGSVCSTTSPRRVVDVTLTAWNEANENGLPLFSAPSPASAYSRSSYVEVGSPLLLPQSPRLVSSASTISTSSSNGALSVLDGSLDNTLYEQLQQVMVENEKETSRRQRAERDMIDAKRRGQEESRQRKEVEEALVKAKEEIEKVKSQKDQVMEELGISQQKEISLKNQIAELHKTMNELVVERDNALKEAKGLRKMPDDHDQFSEFPLSELEEATQKFDESQKIGQGGYGNIYKALLRQKEVAIKMLQSPGAHGTSQFQMEVSVLSQLRHPNLVKLTGSCPEVFALIYEYLPNGSLEDRLSMRDNTPPLSWQTRTRIATELCSVLVYLHSAKPHSIVHGDLKPSNILLDANFFSKLSDFGICRMLLPDASSSNNATTLSHITVPKGSFAFIDPEFLETGVLTLKSDVYSFGIILLQLLTGRQPFLISNEVKNALGAGNLKTLLDPSAGDWPIALAQNLAKLALRCCDRNRENRPDLASDVWKVLEPMKAASCGASFSSQLGS